MLELYTSGFDFHLYMVIHVCLPNLDNPRWSSDVIAIFKMAAVSHIELPQGYCSPPTKCKWGLRSILKFRLDRINSFGDIAVFWCWVLAHVVVSAAHAQNQGLVYFRSRN